MNDKYTIEIYKKSPMKKLLLKSKVDANHFKIDSESNIIFYSLKYNFKPQKFNLAKNQIVSDNFNDCFDLEGLIEGKFNGLYHGTMADDVQVVDVNVLLYKVTNN